MTYTARTALFGASMLAMTAGTASAQEIAQASSDWFTQGQSTLQEILARQPITKKAKNVILMVADGNGVGTNYATRLFAGQSEGKLGEEHVLPYEAFPNLALVKTYNINAQTSDSAPTAGSMNSGVKQIFNTINLNENALHDDCTSEAGNKVTLFSELMSDAGKSVGVVSTARITHATPAAVYASTANRNWEGSVPEGCDSSRDIALQLIEAMKAGSIDLAMGGGRRYFAPDGVVVDEETKGRRADGRNLIDEAVEAGMQYAWNTETANALKLDGSAPVLALFEASHMKYEYDRDDADEPSIVDMTRMAIEALSTNENGYYLMVEAGRVDHANHDGNLYRVLTDGKAFADAVALADELTDDEDTLIIATADHEHAIAFNGYCGRGSAINGLCMGVAKGQVMHSNEPLTAADGKPYTVVGYLNGPGAILTEQADGSYFGTRATLDQQTVTDADYLQQAALPMSSETHSGEDVAVYAKGPWAHLFDGTIEQNYIFHVMNYAANHGAE